MEENEQLAYFEEKSRSPYALPATGKGERV